MIFIMPIILVSFLAIATLYFTKMIVYPKCYSHDYIKNYELEDHAYRPDFIDGFKHQTILVPSIFDYNLRGEIYLQEDLKAPCILICHGITVNYHSSMKYVEVFLKEGYSVMIYDQRNHGYNEKMHTSLGYFEKYDAKACIDYIFHSFTPKHVGVMGESMGAATAMQLATIDDRLAFCIEDCGYSDAYKLMKYRASKDHNPLLAQLVFFTNIVLRLRYKWSLEDVSVIHKINDISCPMMFIHGEDDDYVPFFMVNDLHQAFKKPSHIFTVAGAKHAKAYKTNHDLYQQAISKFLSSL